MPECQKIEKGGLDQYGPECFGRLIFATIRKSMGLKRLNAFTSVQGSQICDSMNSSPRHRYQSMRLRLQEAQQHSEQ